MVGDRSAPEAEGPLLLDRRDFTLCLIRDELPEDRLRARHRAWKEGGGSRRRGGFDLGAA